MDESITIRKINNGFLVSSHPWEQGRADSITFLSSPDAARLAGLTADLMTQDEVLALINAPAAPAKVKKKAKKDEEL